MLKSSRQPRHALTCPVANRRKEASIGYLLLRMNSAFRDNCYQAGRGCKLIVLREDYAPDGANVMFSKMLMASLSSVAVMVLTGGTNVLAGQKEDAYEESLQVSQEIVAIHNKLGPPQCFLARASGKRVPQPFVNALLVVCDLADFAQYREDLPALQAILKKRVLDLTDQEKEATHRYTRLIRISKGLPPDE